MQVWAEGVGAGGWVWGLCLIFPQFCSFTFKSHHKSKLNISNIYFSKCTLKKTSTSPWNCQAQLKMNSLRVAQQPIRSQRNAEEWNLIVAVMGEWGVGRGGWGQCVWGGGGAFCCTLNRDIYRVHNVPQLICWPFPTVSVCQPPPEQKLVSLSRWNVKLPVPSPAGGVRESYVSLALSHSLHSESTPTDELEEALLNKIVL